MGTLPGAAPAKADLNAADQPLGKKINHNFPTYTIKDAQPVIIRHESHIREAPPSVSVITCTM